MKSSKKITKLFLTLFVLILTLSVITACGEGHATVTFDSNGGSVVNSVTVAAGEKVAAPATPTKENYVFAGWETEGGIWDFNKPVNADMTLVARWEKSADADTVSVVFNTQGGSAVETVKVTRGTVIGAPTEPTRAGYSFAGWMNGKEAFNFSTALYEDVDLSASWALVEYSVSYELAGGTAGAGNPAKYNTESASISLAAPTRAGYSFTGWTYLGQETPVKELSIECGSTGDKTYTANWELVTYAITYDYCGGTGAEAPVASYNITSEPIAVANPAKADYVFLGWTYGDVQEPRLDLVIESGSYGDLALVANYAPVKYNINYALNGGTNAESNPASYSHEDAFTLAEPTRAGYTFLGWTYGDVQEPTKDVTVTAGTKGEQSYSANWEIVTYNITYIMSEGISSNGMPLKETFTVEDLPFYSPSIFSAEGNAFLGWYAEESLESKLELINTCGDVTLYAAFAPATEGLVFEESSFGYTVKGYTGESTAIYIPEFYEGKPVIAVAPRAFEGKTAITEVYLPYRVQSIGASAFAGCSALTSLNLRLDGITEEIGESAFESCVALKSLKLPASLKTIAPYAFTACLELSELSFAEGSQLTSIGKNAFESCLSIESLVIPKSVTSIGNAAFSLTASLKSVVFESGSLLASIPEEAFYASAALEEIIVPATVKDIKASAFHGATALKSVTFAEGSILEAIGDNAFYGCDALVTIAVPDTLKTIGASAFSFSDKLETVIFTENSRLEEIGASAFYDCESLTSMLLPKTVKEIGASAFYYCAELESLTLGESLKTVGRTAFYNCSALKELTLPATLADIGKDAFRGCDGITKLELTDASGIKTAFGGTLPATLEAAVINGGSSIEANAFAGTALKTLTVPFVGTSTDGGKLADIFGGSVPATLEELNVLYAYPITAGAFDGASSIKRLTLSPEILEIADGALSGCNSIEALSVSLTGTVNLSRVFGIVPMTLKTVNATLPEDGNSLASNAFRDSYVTTVTISDRTIIIGSYAFAGLKTLTNLTIPEGTTLAVIGEGAFNACEGIKELHFGGAALSIAKRAFYESSLERFTFAEGIKTTLANGAFEGVSKLTSFDTTAAGVTAIPEEAFAGCLALTEFTVGDAVTVIGAGAFENCARLSTITISEDCVIESIEARAFRNSAIKSIYIPEKLTSIAPFAFENCRALETVTFAESGVVKEIGANAFTGSGIKTITLPASLEKIQESAFASAPKLESVSFAEGSQLKKISTAAFAACPALKTVSIPDGVSIIANDTFKNCKLLETVSFGEGSELSAILAGAFENCSSLKAFEVPKGTAYIEEYAFAQCFSLETLTFKENAVISSIATFAFYNCDSLKALALPASLLTLGEKAFYNCGALETLTFAEGTQLYVIPASAFEYCDKLAAVAIPDSVNVIGNAAFANCSALASVSFGAASQLLTIEDSAFRNCVALTAFEAPALLEYIGRNAFSGCTELATVTLSVNIDTLSDYLFLDCAKLTIKINYLGENTVPATWSTAWNSEGREVVWVDLAAPAPAPAA